MTTRENYATVIRASDLSWWCIPLHLGGPVSSHKSHEEAHRQAHRWAKNSRTRAQAQKIAEANPAGSKPVGKAAKAKKEALREVMARRKASA